jgi:hypothetical protein
MKKYVLLLLLGVGLLSVSGCMSSALIHESREPKTYRYKFVTYNNAFIADNVLTLNGLAHLSGQRDPVEKKISARYLINPVTGMPASDPSDIVLRTRWKPKEARCVPIVYVNIPCDDIKKRFDPQFYYRFSPTNTIPAIFVSIPDLPGATSRTNTFEALFVNGSSYGPLGSTLLRMPSHEKTVSQRALLVFIPLALFVDIVSLPLLPWMIEQAYAGLYSD